MRSINDQVNTMANRTDLRLRKPWSIQDSIEGVVKNPFLPYQDSNLTLFPSAPTGPNSGRAQTFLFFSRNRCNNVALSEY